MRCVSWFIVMVAVFWASRVALASVDLTSRELGEVIDAIADARSQIGDLSLEFEVHVKRSSAEGRVAEESSATGWTHYRGDSRYATLEISRGGRPAVLTRAYWGPELFAGHRTPSPGAYLRELSAKPDEEARVQQAITGGVDWLLYSYGLGDAPLDSLRRAVLNSHVETSMGDNEVLLVVGFSEGFDEKIFEVEIDVARGPCITSFRAYDSGRLKIEHVVQLGAVGEHWVPTSVLDRQFGRDGGTPVRELRGRLLNREDREEPIELGLAFLASAGVSEGILHRGDGSLSRVSIPDLREIDSGESPTDGGGARRVELEAVAPGVASLTFGPGSPPVSSAFKAASIAVGMFAFVVSFVLRSYPR